jgi:hypothetical protein
MRESGSLALYQYWDRLRGSRMAPRRTDVEPADIKSLLGDTFILERDMRGEAIFRLAGTRLCAVYGRELKGFAFASLWRDRDRKLVTKLVNEVFQTGAVICLDLEGYARPDRSAHFEFVLLPLDGGAESSRCIGALSISHKPFWLGGDPVVDTELCGTRIIDPELDPLFLKNRPSIPVPSLDMTNTPAPEQPLQNGRRIRHLLVLEGGRDD